MEEIKTENKTISIEDIVKLFQKKSEKKKIRDIKSEIRSIFINDLFSDADSLDKQVEKLIREDKNKGNESELIFSKQGYGLRPLKKDPLDGKSTQRTEYIGRAGECAVMSELLFNDYNVNRMMVDEGVDLVAVKDNIYYYIQVKTVNVKDGKIYTQISNNNFDKYMGKQMRYILVARSSDSTGNPQNLFFKLTQDDIDQGIFEKYIKKGEGSVSIKIKFDSKTGNPKLYDEKERDASWYMNKFNL